MSAVDAGDLQGPARLRLLIPRAAGVTRGCQEQRGYEATKARGCRADIDFVIGTMI